MNQETCIKIFATFEKINPHPTTELLFNSEFELLIAVMLSAQATDTQVNKITRKLFKIANTPQKILALGEEALRNTIKSIGLYNSKAKNIITTCEILIKKHHGLVPNSREQLEALPGVGRKTANVLLNTAFEQDTIAVDTHIFRVSNRTRLAIGKTPLAVEKGLLAIIPARYLRNAHHWLVLHGRYICTARKPKCGICPIEQYCEYDKKELGSRN